MNTKLNNGDNDLASHRWRKVYKKRIAFGFNGLFFITSTINLKIETMRKVIYTLSFLCVCAQVTAQNAAWRNLYIPNIPISTPIWDIVFDKDTNFYVTTDTSLFRYNGGVWSKLIPPISANEKLRYLAIDNQGGLWVSVLDSGVLRYYNNTWKKYNSSNSAFITDEVTYMKNDSLSKFMVIGTDNSEDLQERTALLL